MDHNADTLITMADRFSALNTRRSRLTRSLQKYLLQERLSAAIRAWKAHVPTGVLLQNRTRISPAVNSGNSMK
jgi:hypothetical protein